MFWVFWGGVMGYIWGVLNSNQKLKEKAKKIHISFETYVLCENNVSTMWSLLKSRTTPNLRYQQCAGHH